MTDFHKEADRLFHEELGFGRDDRDPEQREMLAVIADALKRAYQAGAASNDDIYVHTGATAGPLEVVPVSAEELRHAVEIAGVDR